MVNRDLKASDFSVISWMDLLVAELDEDLEPLKELEDPEGPARSWQKNGKQNSKRKEIDENKEE